MGKGNAGIEIAGQFVAGDKVALHERRTDTFDPDSNPKPAATVTVGKDGLAKFGGLQRGNYWLVAPREDIAPGRLRVLAVIAKSKADGGPEPAKKTPAKVTSGPSRHGEAVTGPRSSANSGANSKAARKRSQAAKKAAATRKRRAAAKK